MKVKLILSSLMFSLSVFAYEPGETVKCQGYLEKSGQSRFYYELNGKILKSVGRHYVIYGYTPVFKSKRLHKVLKVSCILPDQEFIEDVVETKEELVEQEAVTILQDPGIKMEKEYAEESQEYYGKVQESDESHKDVAAEAPSEPIDVVDTVIQEQALPKKELTMKSEKTPSSKTSEECRNLTTRGVFTIFKCFMKDGYGSF